MMVPTSPRQNKGIERLIRKAVFDSAPYTPVLPTEVLETSYDIGSDEIIKLDGNENPYGCSPKVQQALVNYSQYHIYPDPEQRELRNALSEYIQIGVEHIVIGSGSDELIDLILRLLIEPGDKVLNCVPTFGMYSFFAEVCGAKVIAIPRNSDFSIDPSAIINAIDKNTKVVFISSPNNPTGNTTSEEVICALLDTGVIVVVDEAYLEFGGQTAIPLVPKHDNLIVLRTFSKWAGLAGLRIGYGIFPLKIAFYINKIKNPYNVNVAARVAAIESLKDLDHLRQIINAIIEERERLFLSLQGIPYLHPFPSQANFLLCSVDNGIARELHSNLQQRGIFLRYFETPLLDNCIRITVGKPKQNKVLIHTLKDFPF
ncbi:MAG: histidinol-phosphate transaminase [Chloroflexota bacterium]|nr:histidinol-phosphate transaminase [Chloroflexota bacterium]